MLRQSYCSILQVWASSSSSSGFPGKSVWIRSDDPDDSHALLTNLSLGSVIIQGDTFGKTGITLTINDMKDSNGVSISTQAIPGTFEVGDFIVTATAGPGGIIVPNGTIIVDEGEQPQFNITPDFNYKIAEVMVNGTSQGAVNTYTFPPVTSNQTINATFLPITWNITATAGTGGIIEPNGTVVVINGTEQNFNITPDFGYEITEVLVNGVSQGAITNYTFPSVTSDQTINATFSPIITWNITATAGTGGIIEPNGTVEVVNGTEPQFNIIPDSGFQIVDVLVNGVSQGAITTYTFPPVTSDQTINATFSQIITWNITATAGTGGIIEPNGTITVDDGTEPQFNITADSGFVIADVLVNGTSIGPVSTYTFPPVHVRSDH